jgi:hypothetical protein
VDCLWPEGGELDWADLIVVTVCSFSHGLFLLFLFFSLHMTAGPREHLFGDSIAEMHSHTREGQPGIEWYAIASEETQEQKDSCILSIVKD